ncbi:Lrp/AsnC ligand binding domain-containing protein [[Eubacterium] cellulosolvens]
MRGYVLVQIEPGYEVDIVEGKAMSAGLNSIKGVVQADVVHGSFDLVVVVEGDPEDIDAAILKIRRIPHVKKTESLLTMTF